MNDIENVKKKKKKKRKEKKKKRRRKEKKKKRKITAKDRVEHVKTFPFLGRHLIKFTCMGSNAALLAHIS